MTDLLKLQFDVNGQRVSGSSPPHLTLLRWLRDVAHVTDPKYGCGEGICGTCTVLVDGVPISSCIVLAAQVDGASITTASGLGTDDDLSTLQRAFFEHHAAQCGFCTPGMIVAAAAILAESRSYSREELRDALHGNLCRCTGYGPILDAIEAAARAGAR